MENKKYTKEDLEELRKDFRSTRRDLKILNFLLKTEKVITDAVSGVVNEARAVKTWFTTVKK